MAGVAHVLLLALGFAVPPRGYELVQLTVITRHGDRSPLTPSLSRRFWQARLPSPAALERVGAGVTIERDAREGFAHSAMGDGVYGTLTGIGLAQMEAVGAALRAELVRGAAGAASADADGAGADEGGGALLSASLAPSELELFSTDFPRTIHSLQALLAGLYPPELRPVGARLLVNATRSVRMIPDAEPTDACARVAAQRDLEAAVRASAGFRRREAGARALGDRLARTLALAGVVPREAALRAADKPGARAVADDADAVADADALGGGAESAAAAAPLPVHWGRVIELCNCLKAHGLVSATDEAARRALSAAGGVLAAARAQPLGWEHGEGVAAEVAAAEAAAVAAAVKEATAERDAQADAQADAAAMAAATAAAAAAADALVGISDADIAAAEAHGAWRWFAVLRAPGVAQLAIGALSLELLARLERTAAAAAREGVDGAPVAGAPMAWPRLTVYSAHDATLIGLLAALRLRAPAHWPQYGAVLRVELLRERGGAPRRGEDAAPPRFAVRFVLGGEPLRRLRAGDDGGEEEGGGGGGGGEGGRTEVAEAGAELTPLAALLAEFGLGAERFGQVEGETVTMKTKQEL